MFHNQLMGLNFIVIAVYCCCFHHGENMVKTEKDSKDGIGNTKWIQMTIDDYVPVWYSSDTKIPRVFLKLVMLCFTLMWVNTKHIQLIFFLCFHVWSMMWMSTFAYVYSGWNEHIVSFCHWSLSLVIVHSEDFWVLDWFFNLLHFQIQHIQISQKGVEFSSVKSVPVESHQSHFWGFSRG